VSAVDDLLPVDGPLTLAELDAWLVAREEALAALLVAEIERILTPRLAAYAESLTAAGDPATLDGISAAWSAVIDKIIVGPISETYLASAVVSYATSPALGLISEIDFAAVVNQRAIEYGALATNRIVGASDALWSSVRQRIGERLTSGVDITELRRDIEEITGYAKNRATTIARTETLGAYNGGDWDSATALGDAGPTTKVWLATGDARTRDSHAEVDGAMVGMEETFNVGGYEMMRPHDPAGPPEETINCRCVLQMYWPGDRLPDGSTVESSPEG
jgi:SPP1 gp7 family putative phage head morphogenesis protein